MCPARYGWLSYQLHLNFNSSLNVALKKNNAIKCLEGLRLFTVSKTDWVSTVTKSNDFSFFPFLYPSDVFLEGDCIVII